MLTIDDIHCNCENIKSFCKYHVYRDLECYGERDDKGLVCCDNFQALPWVVVHDLPVVLFRISDAGRTVYVALEMEDEDNE